MEAADVDLDIPTLLFNCQVATPS